MVTDTGGESELDDAEIRSVPRSLSQPTFQPIRSAAPGPGTDSEAESSSKRVRFARVAEVRSMSAKEALHANLARLSYAASVRAQVALERAQNRLTVVQTAKLALTFSLLWFLGNYSYQAALADTEAGVVNVLSASSCLFTLLLSAIFPSTPLDRISLTKLVAVIFTMSGVVLVSYSDLKLEEGIPMGSLWTLAGALCYSSYIVFLRRKIDHEDKLDVPMFFGFVGFFSFILLWPVFFILHFTNHERFELPTRLQVSQNITQISDHIDNISIFPDPGLISERSGGDSSFRAALVVWLFLHLQSDRHSLHITHHSSLLQPPLELLGRVRQRGVRVDGRLELLDLVQLLLTVLSVLQ